MSKMWNDVHSGRMGNPGPNQSVQMPMIFPLQAPKVVATESPVPGFSQ